MEGLHERERGVNKDRFFSGGSESERGEHFGTCVEYNIISEKEDYKVIGLHGFDDKLFEEEEGGGAR